MSHLPAAGIGHDFADNHIEPGPFGPSAKMGAEATLTLAATHAATMDNAATLRLRSVNGHVFTLKLAAH